jgi:hypothetical protein
MSGRAIHLNFDTNLRPRERQGRLPRVALRQRSSDHPMVMFAMLVAAGFVSMALMMPATVAALPAEPGAPAKIAKRDASDKGDRLQLSDLERSCGGQTWGAEDETCLAAIAKASGRAGKPVRMVAADGLARTTPNIF